MLKIKGTTISFNRGDDVFIQINVYDSDGQPYNLREGDALYFSAKAKDTDKNYAIPPKKLEYDVIHLAPADTYDLAFGEYVYDVQLITAEGRETTVIVPSVLNILPAITAHGDR